MGNDGIRACYSLSDKQIKNKISSETTMKHASLWDAYPRRPSQKEGLKREQNGLQTKI